MKKLTKAATHIHIDEKTLHSFNDDKSLIAMLIGIKNERRLIIHDALNITDDFLKVLLSLSSLSSTKHIKALLLEHLSHVAKFVSLTTNLIFVGFLIKTLNDGVFSSINVTALRDTLNKNYGFELNDLFIVLLNKITGSHISSCSAYFGEVEMKINSHSTKHFSTSSLFDFTLLLNFKRKNDRYSLKEKKNDEQDNEGETTKSLSEIIKEEVLKVFPSFVDTLKFKYSVQKTSEPTSVEVLVPVSIPFILDINSEECKDKSSSSKILLHFKIESYADYYCEETSSGNDEIDKEEISKGLKTIINQSFSFFLKNKLEDLYNSFQIDNLSNKQHTIVLDNMRRLQCRNISFSLDLPNNDFFSSLFNSTKTAEIDENTYSIK